MSDRKEVKRVHQNEDLTEDSLDDDLSKGLRSVLRDAVRNSMLPRNFEDLKKFFDSFDNLGENKNRSETPISQSPNKGPSKELKAFCEISYMKFKKISSSEEESCCSKDSHVDSEDSGLFKEGYVFERKSRPISKDTVDKKVKKWKKIASEKLEEVNKLYQHGRPKNKETFSLPLGLEANRKTDAEPADDVSSQLESRISGQLNTEDEMDIRRNDEFMREVRRVLRSKKNPQTLEKRSLPEEYSRLIFKKTAFTMNQDRQAKALALTGKGEPVTENADTGADGDNTSEPITGIFDQLSKMVLKNKIAKNSKASQQRNEVLRRVEEKRGYAYDVENSDVDEKVYRKIENEPKKEFKSQPGPSSKLQAVSYNGQNQASIENQHDLQIDQPVGFSDIANQNGTARCRLKKVESYLSSISDVQSFGPAMPEISELTTQREQSLFDSLAGEFLKNLATGNEKRNKITRNDKKLLTIIVKRYIDRGELAQIDQLMNSNINENLLEVPPYENVTDREEFFLKKIMRKFIKRGMRNALEDLIAWIYYTLDARKAKKPDTQEDKIYSEKEVHDMVNAFKNSGKNPSMNRIVVQLLREHKKANPGLSSREIEAVKETIKDMVVERFARTFLERTKTDIDRNSEPYALSVNVKNEFEMNSGMEHIDVNGRDVHINWMFDSMKGGTEQPHKMDTDHETDEESSGDETSQLKRNEAEILSRDAKAIKPELKKEANFVKERLEDIVWKIQQTYHRDRQKFGQANRTCSLVKKRSFTMIGEQNKGGKFKVKCKERKSDFEERRKQMREEHVKWLLEQKELLREAKKKEASNIEKYTQALPKSLESMIAKRNRSLKQYDHRNTIDKYKPTAKLRKK